MTEECWASQLKSREVLVGSDRYRHGEINSFVSMSRIIMDRIMSVTQARRDAVFWNVIKIINLQKSETRLTASILKQDLNIYKVQKNAIY